MIELLIPVAVRVRDNLAIRPHEWVVGDEGVCPLCRESITWRRESVGVRRSHFAHRPDSTCPGGESAMHLGAKLLAARQVKEWLDGTGEPILIFAPCVTCQHLTLPQPMLECSDAIIEHTLPSGLRPDIWLPGTGTGGAVEILYSHPIGSEKIASYKESKLWWIEIQARELLDPKPTWIAARSSGLRPWLCVPCAKKEANDQYVHARRERRGLEAALLKIVESEKDLRKREEVITEKIKKVTEATAELEEEKIRFATHRKNEAPLLAHAEALRAEALLVSKKAHEAHARALTAEQEVKQRMEEAETAQRNQHAIENASEKTLRLVDLRKLEETYAEVFAVTERARARGIRYQAEAEALEARLKSLRA